MRAGFGLGWEGFWVEADGFWGVDFVFGEGQLGFVVWCVRFWGLVDCTGTWGVVFGDQGFLFVVGRADFGLGRAWASWFWVFGIGLGNVLGLGHGLGECVALGHCGLGLRVWGVV